MIQNCLYIGDKSRSDPIEREKKSEWVLAVAAAAKSERGLKDNEERRVVCPSRHPSEGKMGEDNRKETSREISRGGKRSAPLTEGALGGIRNFH